MARVKTARSILHNINTDNKGDSWNSLILKAQLELKRLDERAISLREAIEIFKRREEAGDPCIGAILPVPLRDCATAPATQN